MSEGETDLWRSSDSSSLDLKRTDDSVSNDVDTSRGFLFPVQAWTHAFPNRWIIYFAVVVMELNV